MRIRPAAESDLPAIVALLAEAQLPVEGVAPNLRHFLIGEVSGLLTAVGGLEVHGDTALLRSVAVASVSRGRGWGRAMTKRMIEEAVRLGVREIYLLTTTAPRFFAHFGFSVARREDAPAAIRGTEEFSRLCPDSAVFMHRTLARTRGSSGPAEARDLRRR